MPANDTLFHTSTNAWKKMALLVTIPCAILPIMLAADGMLSAAVSPLLFPGDWLLYSFIYLLYFYGLILSRQYHRKPWPLLLFMTHLSFIGAYLFMARADTLLFASIISIILTSVLNQYYRTGSIACRDCACAKKN